MVLVPWIFFTLWSRSQRGAAVDDEAHEGEAEAEAGMPARGGHVRLGSAGDECVDAERRREQQPVGRVQPERAAVGHLVRDLERGEGAAGAVLVPSHIGPVPRIGVAGEGGPA